ncbi:energy transducer TonB [Costertonia aggregata]|uniref:Energy transducer TonB n=1 Tax=Costertonia aggregata TaxID=343403 RepID=A0A7H9AR91_9FLAO|nr:energy transducer TonB [Costertonia aggregata]QLG45954.1 energy transducer TonB [Costertonia aggregata]
MSFLDTRHKKKSFTLTTLLLSVLLLFLLYIGLNETIPKEEKGITVNFGTTDFGSGRVQPKEKIRSEPLDTPPVETVEQEAVVTPVQEQVQEEKIAEDKPTEKVLTQESEESIRIKQQREAKRKADDAAKKAKAEADKKARAEKAAAEKAQRERDAKKKSVDNLFDGFNKSDGTASGSEGDDDKTGDKGKPEGNPYAASYYGSPGSGSGTGGYGLGGRSLVSKGAVQQDCNQEGRVVVEIHVDRSGKVIKARPGVKGTTNKHPCLLKPAKETAFKHKWNLDSKAPSPQVGFVVVNFKLGE